MATPDMDAANLAGERAARDADALDGAVPEPVRLSSLAARPVAIGPAAAPDDDGAAEDGGPDTSDETADEATAVSSPSIATSSDAAGAPVHRGWLPVAGHHRWLEPFVLMALAGGSAHGYAIVASLTQVGASESALDVGQVYRTLRDLEQSGQISSTWATGTGPARRDYVITPLGERALDEWAAVMRERGRLIAEFDATYLGWLAARHGRRARAAQG